jgi:hypothetical protein
VGLGAGTVANGVSAKFQMGRAGALQMNLGSFGGGGAKERFRRFRGLAVSADYLYAMPVIARVKNAFDLAWNLGFGVGVGSVDSSDGAVMAGAFVAGLEFLLVRVPIDIVIEYRPAVLLVPYVGFDAVDFTAQIRYYF